MLNLSMATKLNLALLFLGVTAAAMAYVAYQASAIGAAKSQAASAIGAAEGLL